MIGQCPLCPYFGHLERDHIIPQKFFAILAKYGIVNIEDKDREDNLWNICSPCKHRKGPFILPSTVRAAKLKNKLYVKAEKQGIYLPRRVIRQISKMFSYY